MSSRYQFEDRSMIGVSALEVDDTGQNAILNDVEATTVERANSVNVLPPVDSGRDAWLFLLGSGVLEFFVWGWPYCIGIVHVYWTQEVFKDRDDVEGILTLAATLQSGLLYLGCGIIAP